MLFCCQSSWSKCKGKMREGIKGGSAARSCTSRQWRRRARRRARGGRGKKEQRSEGLSARNSRITLPEILTAARNSSAPLYISGSPPISPSCGWCPPPALGTTLSLEPSFNFHPSEPIQHPIQHCVVCKTSLRHRPKLMDVLKVN